MHFGWLIKRYFDRFKSALQYRPTTYYINYATQ